MNHNKKITELTSFRIVTLSMLFVVILSIYLIRINTPLIINLSADGFNTFTIIFNFPIKCIASYLAIIGLISLNHRSEQTAKQIEVAESQNKFSNHFKNLEEFDKYMVNKNPNLINANFYMLYHLIFPHSRDDSLNLQMDLLDSLEDKLSKSFKNLVDYFLESQSKILNKETLLIELDYIERMLSVFFNDKQAVFLAKNNRNFVGMLSEHEMVHSRIYQLRNYINALMSILDFEYISYSPSLVNFHFMATAYEESISNGTTINDGHNYTISLHEFKSMLSKILNE